jgi:8-amino-7-oxononanoate synthase
MDADSPDLPALRRLCDRHDAGLIVDEAHALGVFGARGAGLCTRAGIVPDALIGTLGKAVGLQGAFVAGPEVLRQWLWNQARSFVFSTGVSPVLAAAAAERVPEVQADDAARSRLLAITSRLRDAVAESGGKILGRGPIIPWVVGSASKAVALSKALLDGGVAVPAIRPPTVPRGASRLRLSANASLTDDEVEQASKAIRGVCSAS